MWVDRRRQICERDFSIVKSAPKPTAKVKRVSKFTGERDLAVVRDIAAAKVHIASNGKTQIKFLIVAKRVNENNLFRDVLTREKM